jgi:hypothetical protein
MPLEAAIGIGQLPAPDRPGGRQGDGKQIMMKNCTNLLAVLMAMAMHLYVMVCIPQ